jgi:peptide/nickel transport system substrate-binding protein
MYVNSKADKLLEDARKSSDESVRLQKYAAFESIIKDDAPAVFLYSPNFIYIVPEKIKGLNLSEINTAWDRWSEVEKWYVNTDSVWKFFAKNK